MTARRPGALQRGNPQSSSDDASLSNSGRSVVERPGFSGWEQIREEFQRYLAEGMPQETLDEWTRAAEEAGFVSGYRFNPEGGGSSKGICGACGKYIGTGVVLHELSCRG